MATEKQINYIDNLKQEFYGDISKSVFVGFSKEKMFSAMLVARLGQPKSVSEASEHIDALKGSWRSVAALFGDSYEGVAKEIMKKIDGATEDVKALANRSLNGQEISDEVNKIIAA